MLRCSVQTITRHCQAGRLDHYDINLGQKKHADYRFTNDMVLKFLEHARNKAVKVVLPRYVGQL